MSRKSKEDVPNITIKIHAQETQKVQNRSQERLKKSAPRKINANIDSKPISKMHQANSGYLDHFPEQKMEVSLLPDEGGSFIKFDFTDKRPHQRSIEQMMHPLNISSIHQNPVD